MVYPDAALLSDKFELAGLFGTHLPGCFTCEIDFRGEFPVGGARAAGAHPNRAVFDRKAFEARVEPASSSLQQHIAHFSAHLAQRRTTLLDRAAARGRTFVRAYGCIGRHHAYPRVIDVELVGRDLRHRGDDALANFHLARAYRDRAIRINPQPAVEPPVGIERGRKAGGWRAHRGVPAAMLRAARWIARTMRVCVPQRQRLRSSAARISSSPGFGFLSSSALALMMMPLAQ